MKAGRGGGDRTGRIGTGREGKGREGKGREGCGTGSELEVGGVAGGRGVRTWNRGYRGDGEGAGGGGGSRGRENWNPE